MPQSSRSRRGQRIDVFVSHAKDDTSEDQLALEAVIQELQANKSLRVCSSIDLLPGDAPDELTSKWLQAATIILLFVTSRYIESM